jgi:uncharacterized protein (TIGR02246 family)
MSNPSWLVRALDIVVFPDVKQNGGTPFGEAMRILYVVIVLTLVPICNLAGQSRVADSIAILQVIQHRTEAMRTHDSPSERSVYAPDAVWINAFGRRRTGADSIETFLTRLYADPGYGESRMVREQAPEILFIRSDVAVVHEYHEREGQRLADGSIIPVRRVHTTFVLSKESGRWLVRYQFIGDERERTPPP